MRKLVASKRQRRCRPRQPSGIDQSPSDSGSALWGGQLLPRQSSAKPEQRRPAKLGAGLDPTIVLTRFQILPPAIGQLSKQSMAIPHAHFQLPNIRVQVTYRTSHRKSRFPPPSELDPRYHRLSRVQDNRTKVRINPEQCGERIPIPRGNIGQYQLLVGGNRGLDHSW